MIAKIIQGTDFNGVINYMLNKPEDKAKVLAATGVRIASTNDIAHDFNLQASMRPMYKKQFVIRYSHFPQMTPND